MEKKKLSVLSGEKSKQVKPIPADGNLMAHKQIVPATPNFMKVLAEEVAKVVIARLPRLPQRSKRRTVQKQKKEAVGGIFLDTSAIIDGRIFDLVNLSLFSSPIVLTEGVLLELKHIADSKEDVKKSRGRRGFDLLNKTKKIKGVRVVVLPEDGYIKEKYKEVDEQLIAVVRSYRGRLITCDYNLEKKSGVQGVKAINMYALAQMFKVAAVPGDKLSVNVLHNGKDPTQGVGYLEDGTMIVVENGHDEIGRSIQITVTRVLQTTSGKILFAKKA